MHSDFYSIFGNETRNKLIICLTQGPKNVTSLIRTCDLTQSAISQHLAKLKKVGLVKTDKVGKEVIYSLIYPQASKISRELLALYKEVISNWQ